MAAERQPSGAARLRGLLRRPPPPPLLPGGVAGGGEAPAGVAAAAPPAAMDWLLGPAAEAFQALFDSVPEARALLDREGRVLRANPAFARLVGPGAPLQPGLGFARLLAEPSRATWQAALGAALRGGGGDGATEPPGATPLVTVSPAGPGAASDAAWILRCRPVALGAGSPPLLLLDLADGAEPRRAAARAAEAARLETVGRLAGGLAHDFNNLLTAILGAASVARGSGIAPAAAAELDTIEDAARRGAALVRQLLALARQQPLQPRVLDLDAALAALAPLLGRLVGREVEVALELAAAGARVRIDPAQLDQVVLNLAVNAREAMAGRGGGTLRIATSRAVVLRPEDARHAGAEGLSPGRYVVLEVADTGCGIPPDALPRLFEPFFTTRPDRGGTGLGLATVQGIVAQSGGHIAVSSRVGEGTCFRIHLPRHAGAEGADVPAAAAARADSPEGGASRAAAVTAAPAAEDGAGRSRIPPAEAKHRAALAPGPGLAAPAAVDVLLVEDEAPLRRLSETLLRRAGLTVMAVETAEAALDLLDSGTDPPRALVSDVAMPGMDGLNLARRLRARWPRLPVLLLSGYAEVMLGADLEAEGVAFLAKPFAPAELPARVRDMLEAAGPARRAAGATES